MRDGKRLRVASPKPAPNEPAKREKALLWTALLLALLAAYSNHFGNGFHFDDAHAVVENPAIRSVSNISRFFADTTTFSHDRAAQTYRPLITTSLAIDYWLGKGLNPFWFHLSTFCFYVIQVLLLYQLYFIVLEKTRPDRWNSRVAWFGTAIYGLHPANAETINYIIQRGDLYVALGMIAGVVVYAWKPEWRRFGFYLLPALAAMFSKPPALIFPALLMAYIVLIDRQPAETLSSQLMRCVPALALSVAFLIVEKAMTPPTFFHTTLRSFDYWITQPYVTLRYFRSFFLPLYLNVDTDLPAFHSLLNPLAILGILFCALLLGAAVLTARRKDWHAISFGLWWFVIGLIPTAAYPLNEVENDHRMFLPFVGLSLSVIVTVWRLCAHWITGQWTRAASAAGLAILVAFGVGTYRRNEVWRTDESLWRDDVEKSPRNARGHDHLGAALSLLPGRLPDAIEEYQAALRIKPDFANAHLNMAKAFARMPGRSDDAIREFETAIRIDPNLADAHMNLGAFLSKLPDRVPEAIAEFQTALKLEPDFVEARYNLGITLAQAGRVAEAIPEYQEALRLRPDYEAARRNLGIALTHTPGRVQEAIHQFETILSFEPDSAEAHTDLGVALSQIPEQRAEAIAQYEIALRINPNYPEARSNLALAKSSSGSHALASLEDLEAFAKTNPDSAEAHYNLGVALGKTPGRTAEAMTQYREALRINPNYADAHTLLGIALARIPGRLSNAISELEATVRIQPNSAEAHSNLALAYQQDPHDREKAIREFEAAFRIKPDPALRQALDNVRASSGKSTQN